MPNDEAMEFWTPSSEQLNYFDITNEGTFKKINPINDRMRFWDNIFSEYGHYWNTSFNIEQLFSEIRTKSSFVP